MLEHEHVADRERDDVEGDDAGMSRSVRRIDDRSDDGTYSNRDRAGDHQAASRGIEADCHHAERDECAVSGEHCGQPPRHRAARRSKRPHLLH